MRWCALRHTIPNARCPDGVARSFGLRLPRLCLHRVPRRSASALLRSECACAPPRHVKQQRGGIYDVSLHGRPGSAATPGLLFAALGSSALPLPGYGTLRLDPASMTLLGAAASTSPAHTVQLAVPNVPALAGTSLHLQGAVLDPLIGVRLTNAIVDTVQ